jgi:hypothetical protein
MYTMDPTASPTVSGNRHKQRLPFLLSGRQAPSDPVDWKPNISAVRATIKYVIATRRLKNDVADRPRALRGSHRSQ